MIEVFIVDDHAVVREGLKQILNETADIKVSGEAASACEFFQKVKEKRWHVLILDLSLSAGRDGLEVLREIKTKYSDLRVLILTMHSEEQYAIRAFKSGAHGFLNKESAPDELVAAIHKIARGEKYISPQIAEKLVDSLNEENRPVHHHNQLSDREFAVLKRIGRGQSLTQIADELLLSVKTVSTYRTRILEKLNIKSNADIVRYIIDHSIS